MLLNAPSYVKETIKTLIYDLDDQNTYCVISSRGTQHFSKHKSTERTW